MKLSKMLALLVFTIFIPALASAQTATINNVEPASKSVSVGQSFSVDATYTTNSVNSCTLGYVESSLPSNWDSSGQSTVSTSNGSKTTVPSPKVSTSSPETESQITLELNCESNAGTVRDTSQFYVKASNPPFLEAKLQTKQKINVTNQTTYQVEFEVSNTGSSKTEGAKALISTPKGYTHPSTITLREAGQEPGVIRPGKSAGTTQFNLESNDNPESGTMSIELTSSEIGTTDTIKVDLDAPETQETEEEDDQNNQTDEENQTEEESQTNNNNNSGGGAQSLQSQNQTDQENNEEKTEEENQTGKGKSPEKISKMLKNLEPGKSAKVDINKSVNSISISVNNPAKQIEVTVQRRNAKPAEVENTGRQTYRYLDIEANVSENNIQNASIDFNVEKEWINQNEINQTQVVLMRYNQGWEDLPTKQRTENQTHIMYSSETPGFSTFAVASKNSQESPGNVAETNGNQTETSQNKKEGIGEILTNPIFYLVMVGLILATGALLMKKRSEIEQEPEFGSNSEF